MISVRPAPGGRVPWFHSDDGRDIHPRVREAMKDLLARTDQPVFLDMTAREMLVQARLTARDSGLLRSPFLQDGPDAIWFTWTGSRIQRTLYGLGQHLGNLKVTDEKIALVFSKTAIAHVQDVYRDFLENCPDAIRLAHEFEGRAREKYETYLSEDLTAHLFAQALDVAGAIEKIREDLCG